MIPCSVAQEIPESRDRERLGRMVLLSAQSPSVLKAMFGFNYNCPIQRLIPIAYSSGEVETAKLAKVAGMCSASPQRKQLQSSLDAMSQSHR